MKILKKYPLSILIFGIVLFLSAFPGDKLPEFDWNMADKLGHFVAYLVLSSVLAFEWYKSLRWSTENFRWLIQIGLISVTYGLIIEVLQGLFFYKRQFDTADIVANSVGCLSGILIFFICRKSIKKLYSFQNN